MSFLFSVAGTLVGFILGSLLALQISVGWSLSLKRHSKQDHETLQLLVLLCGFLGSFVAGLIHNLIR